MMASEITAPRRVIRLASHGGTRPPCSGRSALPALRAIVFRKLRRDGLDDFEPLELRVRDRQRAALTGVAMRRAEGFRPCPRLEFGMRTPDRVRGVEHMVVALRPLEQVKLDKPGYGMEVRVALAPARLEGRLFAFLHLEPVHRDVH